MLGIVRASLDSIPLGGRYFSLDTTLAPHLTSFLSVMFVMAFGVAGGAILCLFLADLSIAMLSRTVPQMNVLILGLQVKTLLILVVLPITFGVAGALLARMASRITLEAISRADRRDERRQEQNRSEQATPYKLHMRAREGRGQSARHGPWLPDLARRPSAEPFAWFRGAVARRTHQPSFSERPGRGAQCAREPERCASR